MNDGAMSELAAGPGQPPGPARVIAVLGVGRSGTSAVARGLMALGVGFGDNLLPPGPENPTGFWEDLDVIRINESILAAAGLAWNSLSPIDATFWERDGLSALRREAVNLVRSRLARFPHWGFKDPRTSRTLPFWQAVFADIGVADSYTITVRNPKSVAHSLQRLAGFETERSYLLWLNHNIQALQRTAGRPRVVVDYDRLLAGPYEQLARVASALQLDGGGRSAVDTFVREFLDPSLRHSQWPAGDLIADCSADGLVHQTYRLLESMAADDVAPHSAAFALEFRDIERSWKALTTFLTYGDAIEKSVAALAQGVRQRDEQIDALGQSLDARDAQVRTMQGMIDSLHGSRSWLLTRPLRWLLAHARRWGP